MDLLQDPRYKDTPVYLFFEKYILNIIGHLSAEKRDILQSINLQEIFATQSSQWQEVVREVLHLSETIDIAILYQWQLYLEQTDEILIKQNTAQEITTSNPEIFSQQFVDEYFSDTSTIDVWTEDSLRNAKQLLQENQLLQQA